MLARIQQSIAFSSLIWLISSVYADTTAVRMALPSRGLSLVQEAKLIGPENPDKKINVTVWLKLRNKENLDKRVNEIYDPTSKSYHQFLTYNEFNQHYAPSKSIEKKIQHYFDALGMETKIINHSVRISATIEQIEYALQVKINKYRYQNRIVYANTNKPTLNSQLAQHVLEITGLSNIARYQPAWRARPSVKNKNIIHNSEDLHFAWNSFIPAAQPTTTSLAGFTGSQLQTTYKVASIPPIMGTPINGEGQTLVIIDACGKNDRAQITSDANLYNNANGITPLSLNGMAKNFEVINPDGSTYTTCGTPGITGWEGEIALDVESSHTLAPGARTVLVLSSSDAAPLDTAVHDVIHTLITHNYTIAGFSNAYVVSNSWGLTETDGISPAMETTLETAAAHGLSFNFSTGDCGDQTYNSSWPCSSNGLQPSVEFPASSAYTTAVGGSSVFVDNNWNYAFEALWGSFYSGAFYGGSTGGISQFYGPVAWQSSISNFIAGGYNLGTIGQYNKRALPDLAMLADPYTGLTIYEDGNSFVYGGTSLACPLFSATLTLINQSRTLLNSGTPNPIGQAAPYLYLNNNALIRAQALHLVAPPHKIIDGAMPPPHGAPLSAFKIHDSFYNYDLTFGWDSSLTISPENQFWNDGVGVGSPNLPNFVATMATM